MTESFEKLGAFYLGKTYDLEQGKTNEELLLFDSKDLTTHGVCFGMTGSGKTGMCVCLLEEALIDNIPVIAIDPKGDLSNLLLNFPNLEPSDFRPWIQESAAKQKGQTPDEYAAGQAKLWKDGLGSWGQTGERIRKIRDAAELVIYTPGSDAGVPVSMLKSFAAPSAELVEDREALRERIQATTGSLLGLLGIDADPVQSREHILLSLILDQAWREGRSLSLPELIQLIQTPPIARVGVFELESFYPSKDRFGLAMALNNLLASPGFESWMAGEPLDLDKFLYTPEGKPRLAIFSIAHLGDAERMFFVSSLVNETMNWMRKQSGTTSLRALLYMDEVYGYLPPTANPPSKQPLMTLMKQARAFGLGVLLATQNPKDIDYKALSNAGAWFIGRLQTDRDRDRVLDGLEAAAAGSGSEFDRKQMEHWISGLDKRVFVLYNVHDDAPVAFHTRWALSYLAGPMTRSQIQVLMADRKAAAVAAAPAKKTVAAVAARPQLPPEIPQYFAPVATLGPSNSRLVYEPALFGAARVPFKDTRRKIHFAEDVAFTTALEDGPVPVDWQTAAEISMTAADLESEPSGQSAEYGELTAKASTARSFKKWETAFKNWIYAERKLTLYSSETLKEVSRPEENERDFRIRLEQLAREERDRLKERLQKKYATKIGRLEERVRVAEQRVVKEKEQAGSQTMQSAISIGASLVGALFGRKVLSATNARRVGTAARSATRIGKERQDVGRAEENLEAARAKLEEMETELREELENLEDRIDPLTETFAEIEIGPKKTAIEVKMCGLCWLPHWRGKDGSSRQAWRV
ncbi:MAG: DUF87 domain-containing protein [Acidobacteria bacterium]|nr:DUF87 domain-containing protein [Acidobacteriota bacterium]